MHVSSMQGMVGNALEGQRRCGFPPGSMAMGWTGLWQPRCAQRAVAHGEPLGFGGLLPVWRSGEASRGRSHLR